VKRVGYIHQEAASRYVDNCQTLMCYHSLSLWSLPTVLNSGKNISYLDYLHVIIDLYYAFTILLFVYVYLC